VRQLQITVPKKQARPAKDVLKEYSTDITSNEGQNESEEEVIEFKVTVESDQIDELTKELKDIKEIKQGKLSIRVIDQESLIEKGQETKGSSSNLSQEEIYSQAQQFSGFDKAEWGLIAVSSAIAAYGLALDNVIVVIGAMMLAPILSPFVSGAISVAVGDKSLMFSSIKSGLLSVALAIVVSFTASSVIPVSTTPTLELVSTPGTLTAVLSLLVGSAAALSFATGLRDQVAGVAVAIALVPPLAAVGIGLRLGNPTFIANAGSVALINISSVLLSGFFTLKLLGLKPSTYYKKKEAHDLHYVLPVAFVVLMVLTVPIVLTSLDSPQSFIVQQEIENAASDHFGDQLLEVRFGDDKVRVLVLGSVDEAAFKSKVTDRVDLEVVELSLAD
jgi:uncharacterized hydrophobic protein (TIGR00341 family)